MPSGSADVAQFVVSQHDHLPASLGQVIHGSLVGTASFANAREGMENAQYTAMRPRRRYRQSGGVLSWSPCNVLLAT